MNWETVNGIFDDPEWSTTVRKLRQIEAVVPESYKPPPQIPPPRAKKLHAEGRAA